MQKQSLFIIVGLFLLLELCANPTGNFALNDDWNYARNVKHLLDYHSFFITPWHAPSALVPVVCAAAFCLPFGFSFEHLRIVTACFSLCGIIATFYLLRRTAATDFVALLGAICLMINPFHFLLSNSFMTDIPFSSMSICASLLALSALENPVALRLAAFDLAAFVLALCRQLGVMMPLSWCIAYLVKNGIKLRNVILSLVPLAISIVTLCVYQTWVRHRFGDLLAYRAEEAYIKSVFKGGLFLVFVNSIQNLMVIFIYVGWFVFPYLLINLRNGLAAMKKDERYFFFLLSGMLSVCMLLRLVLTNQSMPLSTNVLMRCGFGPLLPADLIPDATLWPPIPFLWAIISSIGVISGACIFSGIVIAALRWRHGARLQPAVCFVLGWLILYSATMSVRGFFDRYLLCLIPFTMAAISQFAAQMKVENSVIPRTASTLAIAGLLSLALFSVLITHDYFAWNRARWQAISRLNDVEHVPLDKIDGGPELNGWIAFDPRFAHSAIIDPMSFAHGDDYKISFIPQEGYKVAFSEKFGRCFPPGEGCIYALKKASIP
jgi:hypothetical protein